MNELSYTLVSDGSSDRTLLPILTWLLRQNGIRIPIQSEWADMERLPNLSQGLGERIKAAVDLYPCDLLFIHRDAESLPFANRKQEIMDAFDSVAENLVSMPHRVCVIPVRMQEAWFLFDESAIREAAGNPNGTLPLRLPSLKDVEQLSNPKEDLHSLLRTASGLRGRRLKKFNPHQHVHRLAHEIEDYSPLRQLHAFEALEADIFAIVENTSWNQP